MAHFAEIDSNNKVLRVLVVGNDKEHRGQDFLANELGLGGTWIQTSFNKNFRKNFAGVGDTYDPVKDAFISEKPFNSWVLDESTCQWSPPIQVPNDGSRYVWNETELNWIKVDI